MIPRALDGLAVDLELAVRAVRVVYMIAERGCGPVVLTLNGSVLPFERDRTRTAQAGPWCR